MGAAADAGGDGTNCCHSNIASKFRSSLKQVGSHRNGNTDVVPEMWHCVIFAFLGGIDCEE